MAKYLITADCLIDSGTVNWIVEAETHDNAWMQGYELAWESDVCEKDVEEIEVTITTWENLHEITHKNCMPLSYIGNVFDQVERKLYAWLKDDKTSEVYLVEI